MVVLMQVMRELVHVESWRSGKVLTMPNDLLRHSSLLPSSFRQSARRICDLDEFRLPFDYGDPVAA